MSTEGSLSHRPTMRRKSSAQNLLSSFKPSTSSSAPSSIPSTSPSPMPTPVPPPPPPPQTATHGSFAASMAGGVSSATPTAASFTPTQTTREWDVQSMHSDSTGAVGGGVTSPQAASIEYLRDLVQKRIITLTYVRNVHDGRSHWFHTIMISRSELDRVFSDAAMKKRTTRFATLGMSLSTLFDIHHPPDLLRAILNTLQEYEQAKEDGERPINRMRIWKRPQKRQAGGMTDYSIAMTPDSSDASYLITPHLPFALSYSQTLLSLLDILSETYHKLSKLLGPSAFPHASQHILGLSPHPGVSYLFSGEGAAPVGESDGLWGVANGGGSGGGGMGSPPPSWTPALGEMMLKIDGKFKKIISLLLKDLDAFARNGIKDELASLDPLLRNMGSAGSGFGDGRAAYDFEGAV